MSKNSREKKYARCIKRMLNFYSDEPTQEIADLFGVELQHSDLWTVYEGLLVHSNEEFLAILNQEAELKERLLDKLKSEGSWLESYAGHYLIYEEILHYWDRVESYCHLADLLGVTSPTLFDELLDELKDSENRRGFKLCRPQVENVRSPTLKRFLETAFV